ncbi:hypothetical protein CR513_31661, partial [Mucuna pruriens]
MKLLATRIIYPILDSQRVSLVQVVRKKSRMTVVKSQNNKLVPTRVICIFILYQQINIKPYSPAHLTPLPILRCCSTCAMPQAPSR